MAKFPALNLYTDAFIADTIHLNAAQTGAYIMLLMAAWRSDDCRLPDDDKVLARYARMNLRQWLPNKPLIMSFWRKDSENKWYQSRLIDERTFATDVRNKNVMAGRISALKRHNSTLTDVGTSVQLKSNPLSPSPTNTLKPPVTDSSVAGVLKNEIGKKVSHDIQTMLSFDGLTKAKRNAPGWDIYALMKIYNARILDRGGLPGDPDRAFAAWCAAYTKGKKP